MEAGGLGGYSPKSAKTGSTDWHCPPPPHPGKAPAGPPFPLLCASVPAPTAAASSPPDCIRTWPEACWYCHGARSCTGMSQARPHGADPLEGTKNNAKVDRPHRCDVEGEAEQWSRTLTGASSGALGGQALEEQAEEARSVPAPGDSVSRGSLRTDPAASGSPHLLISGPGSLLCPLGTMTGDDICLPGHHEGSRQ